jgi:hypothetical protein
MRICIENRLHKRDRYCEPMIDQMKRRIFWVCYVSDRHSSSVLGRPMAIQDEEIEAEVRLFWGFPSGSACFVPRLK